jgi:RHS repeat-associated protein
VRQLATTDGAVLDALTYDSYGNILDETNPENGDRFKYTGREYDAVLGMYYYRARYYAPGIGCFVSEDPLGFAGGDTNLYRYAGNGPTNATDPTGLQPISWWDFTGPVGWVYWSIRGWMGPSEAEMRRPIPRRERADIVDLPYVPGSSYLGMTDDYYTPGYRSRPREAVELARPLAELPVSFYATAGMAASVRLGPRLVARWRTVREAMSASARVYQQQITGRSGGAYFLNGVKFDGIEAGVLLEAKGPGYATFVRSGEFLAWFRGRDALVDQARRQIAAARGTPITWHVAEEEAATAIRTLFRGNGITGINIVHTPVVP